MNLKVKRISATFSFLFLYLFTLEALTLVLDKMEKVQPNKFSQTFSVPFSSKLLGLTSHMY